MRLLLLSLAVLFSLPAPAQQAGVPAAALTADAAQPAQAETWWKHAVVYEIYPRSFKDSNGDGIGDLNGITEKLGYLQHLGVTAIWIAPMYPSPQVDFGYDVANYEAVDPQYGTMADFDRLLREATQHHIRIILDMVMNHTSDKNPWFVDSASSRTNPHADWYVWNDGKPDPTNGHALNAHKGPHGWVVPPNNWQSLFQGSAWEWVPARGQFYYHFFYKQQPDLNYRNPVVEKAMFDAVRFWLDKGVAGFRLDAIDTIYEDPSLKDEPLTGKLDPSGFPETTHVLTSNLPEVHGFLERLHAVVAAYPGDRMLIGEIYSGKTDALRAWYGTAEKPQLELPMDTLLGFYVEGNSTYDLATPKLSVAHFRKYISEAETELDGHTPLFVFDNHDNERSWDRFTTPTESAEDKERIARMIAAMLYTTHAAALTYYGAEIGMVTHTPTRREDVRDPIGITGWPQEKGRDGERTPMQWTDGAQAGFSTNPHTWLPVGNDYTTVNVAGEEHEPGSLLRWNEALIRLRATNNSLRNGGTVMLDDSNTAVLSYLRTAPAGAHPVLVSLNMSAKPQTVHLSLAAAALNSTHARVLLTDGPGAGTDIDVRNFTLPPFSTLIAEVQ